MLNKVLVASEGSPVAEMALPCARSLARGGSLSLDLLSDVDLDQVARHIATDRERLLDTLDDYAPPAYSTALRVPGGSVGRSAASLKP